MGRRRGEDMRICWTIVTIACLLILVTCVQPAVDGYKIGVGRADCTGPSVEVIFVSINWFDLLNDGVLGQLGLKKVQMCSSDEKRR